MAAIQSPGDGLVTPRRFRLTHDIAEVSHDRVDPVTLLPNRGDRALSFFIPKTSSRCVDFSNIQLHLRLRLVSGLEGNPLNPDKSYVIPGFVPSTIFGSLAVRVNDTEITNASQYPILSRFLMLTQMEAGRREVLQQVNHFEGWDEENVNQRQMMVEVEEAVETDEGGEGEDGAENSAAADPPKKRRKVKVWTMLGNRFPNYKTRSNRFTREGGRGSTTYSSYLITELSGGSAEKALVLPPCDIALDFIPAEPGRAVITDVENPDVRVEIMEAHLSVPRILPKGGSIPRSLRWNFHRTKITPIIIPKDRMEFHAAITYSGLIGRRISLLLMDHDNWEGNFRSSIYRSHNFNVDSIELHVGSRVLPTTRIRANFERRETNEMYMYVLDSLKWSLRRTGAGPSMLEKSEWEQGSFLWSADTSVDRRAGAGYKGHPEAGSINLSVSFHKKTPDQLVAVVVSEATAELRMESDGSVKVLD